MILQLKAAIAVPHQLPPDPPEITAVAEELPAIVKSLDLAEVRVENKGRALAVHTRKLSDPRAAFTTLSAPLHELAARHGLVVEQAERVGDPSARGGQGPGVASHSGGDRRPSGDLRWG